ncbi:unnamed protein product [Effrenium voratum]|nr:unnamed protein product [Effrenium voratum]
MPSQRSHRSKGRTPREPPDTRGYESLEQLLAPWGQSSRSARGARPKSEATKRNSLGKALWSQVANTDMKVLTKPSTAPPAPRAKQQAKVEKKNWREAQQEKAKEDAEEEEESDHSSESEDSVDPMLERDIGDLLPKSTWTSTLTKVQTESARLRRGGLDKEMIEMAGMAVAAQQAALREQEEMNLPTQVFPGVYFGHMESPKLVSLPSRRRIGGLQKLERRKIQEDTADQRMRFKIPDKEEECRHRAKSSLGGRKLSRLREEIAKPSGQKKTQATWTDLQKGDPPPKHKEEEQIKEEKAQSFNRPRAGQKCS